MRRNLPTSQITRSLLPGLIAAILGLASLVVAQKKAPLKAFDRQIQSTQSQLDSIKAQLESDRKQLESLKKKEGSELSQLKLLEKNIAATNDYLEGVNNQIDSIGVQVGLLEDSLDAATDQLAVRQSKMKARLRSMYKSGRLRMPSRLYLLEIMLTSVSPLDIVRRVRYFQELIRYDRLLVSQIQQTKSVIKTHRDTLHSRLVQLAELKKEKELEQEQLQSQRSMRSGLLKEVRSRKKAYLASIRELEASQKKLNDLITRLIKKRKHARTAYERSLHGAFEKLEGNLPWPVEGQIIKKYGKVVHPVYKTVTMNTGVDIRASTGSPVRCVASGNVIFIGAMRGLGQFIMVDHGGDYLTIYANLGSILVQKEQKVAFGTPLGLVGKAGKLDESKVHFEIRKKAQPLDPQKWLE
ncbi:MAG: peptidoglycan DD-metalloendopeptidase family protein [Chitinivibrionales bacterium]|nr:peptidoglycan DD-metalloendopeptidase family protein [Chitinivibrionales bacterium]